MIKAFASGLSVLLMIFVGGCASNRNLPLVFG